jgi:hypothetical protein
MQGLAGEREMGFAQSLALCGVGMNQSSDIRREGIPISDQLRFAGKLTHSGANHVYTGNGTIRLAYELDESPSLENL